MSEEYLDNRMDPNTMIPHPITWTHALFASSGSYLRSSLLFHKSLDP